MSVGNNTSNFDSRFSNYRVETCPNVNCYRKDHNNGVFDAYTPEIRGARHAGIVTGLPDAYGRGRIIGDYRRVALYGIDRLLEDKAAQKGSLENVAMSEDVIRQREELSEKSVPATFSSESVRSIANPSGIRLARRKTVFQLTDS